MRNEQNSPVKRLQHFLKRFAGGKIEMVRGLIQKEDIAASAFQKRKLKFGSQAPGELFDLFIDILRFDPGLRQELARICLRHQAVLSPEGVEHAILRIEIGILLIVIGDTHKLGVLYLLIRPQKIL